MNLREKTIQSLGWSFGARVFRQISQFVVLAILARLLSPDDFGLIGMVAVFAGFAFIFADLGITAAIIQKQDLAEKHYSSAFWINIAAGICLVLIFISCARLIADFYHQQVLKDIIRILSLNFLFSSFSIVHLAIFKREMNFKAITIAESIAVVISGIIGIYLAFAGYGVWSLVVQLLSCTFVNTCFLWIFSGWRPRLLFEMAAIKEIFNFSANVTGAWIVKYLSETVDYLLVGKFLGAGALGFYTLAYKIMIYPLQHIVYVMGGVMFPAFSRIHDDLKKVRDNYLKIIKLVSLVIFPLIMGLFVVAPEFIRIVFGEQWEPVVPVLRILCFCGIFQSFGTAVENIFMSQGRSDIQFKVQLIGTLLVVVFISIGLKWGIVGVASAYAIYIAGWVPFTLYISSKLINLHNNKLFKAMLPALLVSILMATVLSIIKRFVVTTDIKSLLISCFVGLSIYFMTLILTKQILISKNKLSLNI
ncbi:MAG: MOP flippase family protein [Candidatus Omnitrophota bacterium]